MKGSGNKMLLLKLQMEKAHFTKVSAEFVIEVCALPIALISSSITFYPVMKSFYQAVSAKLE